MKKFSVLLGIALILMHSFPVWPVNAPPQRTSGVFFSQGQAIFNPQDRSNSQKAAIQDFMVQAIMQAASTFLSPGQLGRHYQAIQEKLLQQPDRYVQTYELFTENPDQGGLYRVTGQVTVSMDLLKKDLVNLGVTRTELEASQPQIVPQEPQGAPSRPAVAQPDKKAGITEKASVSGEEVLWVVPEKWDDEWQLPEDGQGSEGLLAAGVFQGIRDYGWTIRLPEMGTLAADDNGEVPAGEALAAAKALGLHHVVVGSVGLLPAQDGQDQVRLQTRLRVLNVSSGKAQGEIHKELLTHDLSAQEAVLELADFVVPRLDRQLREASQAVPSGHIAASPEETGELVLQFRSRDAYTDWLALEKALREQFKDLQIKGFEIQPEVSIVRIVGVDGTSFMNLNGTRLPNGLQLQISNLGGERTSFSVTLVKSEVSPPEPKQ